jgi:hypothetical protein
MTAWNCATNWGNLEALHKIWKWAKEKLTRGEINNKFLLGTDSERKTVLHLVEEGSNLEGLQQRR